MGTGTGSRWLLRAPGSQASQQAAAAWLLSLRPRLTALFLNGKPYKWSSLIKRVFLESLGMASMHRREAAPMTIKTGTFQGGPKDTQLAGLEKLPQANGMPWNTHICRPGTVLWS